MKISVLQMPVAIGGREKNTATLRRMLKTAMKDAGIDYVYQSVYELTYSCLIRLLSSGAGR